MRLNPRTQPCIHVCVCPHAHVPSCARALMRMCSHAHVLSSTCALKCMCSHAHVLSCARALMRSRHHLATLARGLTILVNVSVQVPVSECPHHRMTTHRLATQHDSRRAAVRNRHTCQGACWNHFRAIRNAGARRESERLVVRLRATRNAARAGARLPVYEAREDVDDTNRCGLDGHSALGRDPNARLRRDA